MFIRFATDLRSKFRLWRPRSKLERLPAGQELALVLHLRWEDAVEVHRGDGQVQLVLLHHTSNLCIVPPLCLHKVRREENRSQPKPTSGT